MKLISHSRTWYTEETFLRDVVNNNNVDGMMVDVVLTKDNKLVIVNTLIDSTTTTLEEFTYEQAKNKSYDLLENVLNYFSTLNRKKKIIINAMISPPLINYNGIEKYTNILVELIKKYNNVDISVCSYNYSLIDSLYSKDRNIRMGIILLPSNSNYIDVDFYIYPPILLNHAILIQQYNRGKENMVILNTWNDLNQTLNFFNYENNKNNLPKDLIDNMVLITEFPDITYNSVKDI